MLHMGLVQVVKILLRCRRCRRPWIPPQSREDPLEEEMATHSRILAWENPMDRGAWRATVCGVAKSQMGQSDSAHIPCIAQGTIFNIL